MRCSRFVSFVFSSVLLVALFNSTAFGVNASNIESVMRKYQNKYHYIAVLESYDSKYLSWPGVRCYSSAPSYPKEFYGEITVAEAESLVNGIVAKFYDSETHSRIYGHFLEKLPDGDESTTNVIVTKPDSSASWQEKLSQVESDLEKLTIYKESAGTTERLEKHGYGDSINCSLDPCNGGDHITENDTFDDAKSDAESHWNNNIETQQYFSGILIGTSVYHSCDDECDDQYDFTGYRKEWHSGIGSENFKLTADLTGHKGMAHSYVKIHKRNPDWPVGEPVPDGISADGKFHEWKVPSLDNWTSDYLFEDTPPKAENPGSTSCSGTDADSKRYDAGWTYGGATVVVEPTFDQEEDAVKSCAGPQKKIYKNQQQTTVYSAAGDCGYTRGEKVSGRILVSGYMPGMRVEVQLTSEFKDDAADLVIDGCNMPCDDTETIFCFSPTSDESDPNSYYIPYYVKAYVGETNLGFTTASVYTMAKGGGATDPNESARIEAYRGEGESFNFKIKTNGYECCVRKETANDKEAHPSISDHENGDVEIYFPDTDEAYIWGNGSSKTCGFLDINISPYAPDTSLLYQISDEMRPMFASIGSGNYLKLTMGNMILIYEKGSEGSVSFKWELDANGNILKEASYDAQNRMSKVAKSAYPDDFYMQYLYEDTANPNRVTGYIEYAGDVAREYTLFYDENGRVSGTIGGSNGCSSCSGSSDTKLYTYNIDGYVLLEKDIEGNVIYEYEYDAENRQIAKWLGEKLNANPVKLTYYSVEANGFEASEIKDVCQYIDDTNYSFTRYYLDSNSRPLAKVEFDELNIDGSTISTDPNLIAASGGMITTYEYEYSGNEIISVKTKSPDYNSGQSSTYRKHVYKTESNNYEQDIVVYVDENGIEHETVLNKTEFADISCNGSIQTRVSKEYDTRGIASNKYTYYQYSNGNLSTLTEPEVTQLNGYLTEKVTNYTYHADGRTQTETDGYIYKTYLYDVIDNPAGVEVRDSVGNLLYSTSLKFNGFGEEVYSIDRFGVARGKEYDSYGRVVSEFTFADANDVTLFANAHTADISSVYTNLSVVNQRCYIYDSLGRLDQTKVAIADSAFTYNTPDDWSITKNNYDSYGRKISQVLDYGGDNLTTTYTFDNQGQIVKTEYPDGHWKRVIRNGRGLVEKTIEGYGAEDTTPNDFIVKETIYDGDGNAIKQIEAGIVVKSFMFDNMGRVYREYQGDFETEYCSYTQYQRSYAGDLVASRTVEIDDLGAETTLNKLSQRFNIRGELIEKTIHCDPNSIYGGTEDKIALYCYDTDGKLVEEVIKSDGNTQPYTDQYETAIKYEAGDLVKQNWYNVESKLEYQVRFEAISSYIAFDDMDDVFKYAKNNRDIQITSFDYQDGKLSERYVLSGFDETDPDFNNPLYPQAGLVWKIILLSEYDNYNRIIKAIDEAGNYCTIKYNSNNKITQEMIWQGVNILDETAANFTPYPLKQILVSYDVLGRKSREATLNDPNSNVSIDNVSLATNKIVDYVYNTSGQLHRERRYFDGENQRIALKEYGYDGLGRIESIVDSELEEAVWVDGSVLAENAIPLKAVDYHYNLRNKKDEETTTSYSTIADESLSVTKYFDYDNQGRLYKIRNAEGTVIEYYFNAAGRIVKETDFDGKTIDYLYGFQGQLRKITEDAQTLNRITEFSFDRRGRKTAVTSGTDQTSYQYNYLDKITKITYPNTKTIDFAYNMQGNAIQRIVTENQVSVATNYTVDELGRIANKQIDNDLVWNEPNSLLPFDEYIYDAMGNKSIISLIDGENSLEINMYSYNGFNKLSTASETYGEFANSLSYGYDQRGLLTSITYTNGNTAIFTRDALGRVETVSYNGGIVAEYGYIGDTVVSKKTRGIEYEALVDLMGRVTTENYKVDNTTFKTNSYGWQSASARMTSKNNVSFGYDTLGRVISEGQISYTCDILGNPTNAAASGLTYALDEDERVTQVSNAQGVVGTYEYDRLGRRIKKTVGSTITYFSYDQYGNIIAEYQKQSGSQDDPEWQRDYVYGAKGEAVYMQLPTTQTTISAFDDFVSFANAWLCYPSCSTADLGWDVNDDDDVDMLDLAVHFHNDAFAGAFYANGRSLLTDLRNSVVGIADGNDITEIGYDAWGTPSYTGNLDSVNILWNGYYSDAESGNYYLRNRYYSPIERKFITEDPHGINPDGNWNNPFSVHRQYLDGYGLEVYCSGDPVNYYDFFGLNLYCIGGTWEKYSDNYNTRKMYDNYNGDQGKNTKQKKYYWNGPGHDSKGNKDTWDGATGGGTEAIINGVLKAICNDYCKDPCVQINIVGWSRGAAIALEVANRLKNEGCSCSNGKRNPRVHWIGLFDAVDMNNDMDPDGTDNANQVDHARKTQKRGKQRIFPTINTTGNNTRNQYFYNSDGGNTSHSDIGTGDSAYNWMRSRAEHAGLKMKK